MPLFIVVGIMVKNGTAFVPTHGYGNSQSCVPTLRTWHAFRPFDSSSLSVPMQMQSQSHRSMMLLRRHAQLQSQSDSIVITDQQDDATKRKNNTVTVNSSNTNNDANNALGSNYTINPIPESNLTSTTTCTTATTIPVANRNVTLTVPTTSVPYPMTTAIAANATNKKETAWSHVMDILHFRKKSFRDGKPDYQGSLLLSTNNTKTNGNGTTTTTTTTNTTMAHSNMTQNRHILNSIASQSHLFSINSTNSTKLDFRATKCF